MLSAQMIVSLDLWIRSLVVFGIAAFIGIVAPLFIVRAVRRVLSSAQPEFTDILCRVVRKYVPVGVILIGAQAAIRLSPLHPIWIMRASHLIMILFVLAAVLAGSRLAVVWIRSFAGRLAMGKTTLIENLARIAIYVLGILLILANLDISITPLLTALGVGSLAVALALQDTLSNLFSGIYIIVSRQIRVGDFIKLDAGGAQGYVADITWRSTTIRDIMNNVIIIPNTKIAQAIVTNFNLPVHKFGVQVHVGVGYGSDLTLVERAAMDVATDVQRTVAGAAPDATPIVRFASFGDSAILFFVILHVHQFEDQYLVVHEFIKRLTERFRRENIEIPFPQRVVHMTGQTPPR